MEPGNRLPTCRLRGRFDGAALSRLPTAIVGVANPSSGSQYSKQVLDDGRVMSTVVP